MISRIAWIRLFNVKSRDRRSFSESRFSWYPSTLISLAIEAAMVSFFFS